VIVGLGFIALLGASSLHAATRAAWRARSAGDWLIDGVGLLVQGVVVPALQVGALRSACAAVIPGVEGAVDLPAPVAFAGAFVGVDALYWLNHRAMHQRALWPLHRVHHEAAAMDLFSTSRNTWLSSFLLVYLWVHGLAFFALADDGGWALGVAATAVLDLWRHTALVPPPRVARWLRGWLVLPDDHARHHADDAPAANFGANLAIWDRLAGTWIAPEPDRPLGVRPRMPTWRALLWPVP
jgi:sterol desaturase/sphingolipid hydroxylase (fatty acid hydroxylase superfamily)